MMTNPLKTLEHTVICTYTHIQIYHNTIHKYMPYTTHIHIYHWARSRNGSINHKNLGGASKRYRTGQNNFTLITRRYYPLWRSLLRCLYAGHSVSGTAGSISGTPVSWCCTVSISAVTPNLRPLNWVLISGRKTNSLDRRNEVSVLCSVILHTSRFCFGSSFSRRGRNFAAVRLMFKYVYSVKMRRHMEYKRSKKSQTLLIVTHQSLRKTLPTF